MADKAPSKAPAAKAHAPKQKSKQNSAWNHYEAKGELKRKNQSCPKCGPGYFMANHKDRKSCGKCAYTEMAAKK